MESERMHLRSVKDLVDSGIDRLPSNYRNGSYDPNLISETKVCIKSDGIPIVDLSGLEGPQELEVVKTIARASAEWGCFQVTNHGVPTSLTSQMMQVAFQFFTLPSEEKLKYFSTDTTKPVRFGTSINQLKDRVLCWRDFLKHYCYPISNTIHLWPSNPPEYRDVAASYVEEMSCLTRKLMRAICRGLELESEYVEKTFGEQSLTMFLNCYPPCPEPESVLGITPHTDYGCVTILLQDQVGGLQVFHHGQWVEVQPLQNSFVVNIGDFLEIVSNGRCKSVEHRSLVNAVSTRLSIATVYNFPMEATIRPAEELVDEEHPKMYRDTNFREYLHEYSRNGIGVAKSFLSSVRLEI
eukprot:Gb_12473 [translate_table: standard]